MKDMLKQFVVKDPFLDKYEALVRDVVIPYQEKILHDQEDVSEKSQAIGNFELAAQVIETGKCDQEFYGMVFQDSDVAKWLEAAAYSLWMHPDVELEKRCDEIIDLIGRAQWEDGYLNTYFTVKAPEDRWNNLEWAHELYCAGHMMEAAVAFYETTGKRKLLDIMSRMGEHIYDRFITKAVEGYPGHPEVELALIRMYEATGNAHFKELADHFINVRGVDPYYYNREHAKADWFPFGPIRPESEVEYLQAHMPVRDQTEAVGHSVRAVYLYSAMADLALINDDDSLKKACNNLWENMTQKRMYVTGAIGSAYEGEAFTKDYHLPNDTAYAETCASIGLIFWARRMLDLEVDSKYADVMERAFYNGVLAGMQLDGTKFFYVNPLEVIPGVSGIAKTHKHALPERPNWFACACCPPNVARLLPSIGRYAMGQKEDVVYAHLFIGGELMLDDENQGKVIVQSSLPYGNKVRYSFESNGEVLPITLAIRRPDWSQNMVVQLNRMTIEGKIEKGYIYIAGPFKTTDIIDITLDNGVKKIYPNDQLFSDSGKMAIQRGPVVYCAEGVDNDDDVFSLVLKKDTVFEETSLEGIGDVIGLKAMSIKRKTSDQLYDYREPTEIETDVYLIPYYTWGNRGLNQMRVWLPYS